MAPYKLGSRLSLSRKLKSQSEVVFCLANGLCGLFCALVISDSAPHEIFLEKESGCVCVTI